MYGKIADMKNRDWWKLDKIMDEKRWKKRLKQNGMGMAIKWRENGIIKIEFHVMFGKTRFIGEQQNEVRMI